MQRPHTQHLRAPQLGEPPGRPDPSWRKRQWAVHRRFSRPAICSLSSYSCVSSGASPVASPAHWRYPYTAAMPTPPQACGKSICSRVATPTSPSSAQRKKPSVSEPGLALLYWLQQQGVGFGGWGGKRTLLRLDSKRLVIKSHFNLGLLFIDISAKIIYK